MKCKQCKQDILDGQTIIPVTGGFVCGLICYSLWKKKREFFDEIFSKEDDTDGNVCDQDS